MPMDPMDVMWMSKPPTVSDVVVSSTVVFKPVVGSPQSPGSSEVRSEFDTDCLLKSHHGKNQHNRTVSRNLNDNDTGRRISESMSQSVSSPIEVPKRTRRLSFTEMIFGSPSGGFSWGQASSQFPASFNSDGSLRATISEDSRFKELMKHQNKVLGDDGVSAFKKRDYITE